LAYGLYSPEVFDPQTGALTPEAVQIDHLRGPRGVHIDVCGASTGVSVCRVDHESAADEMHQTLRGIVDNREGRHLEGAALIDASSVRQIKGADGMPALDVLDDGASGYVSHAVIRGAPGLGRGALRAPRHELVTLLNAGVQRQKG
jgi:hypothetical protein